MCLLRHLFFHMQSEERPMFDPLCLTEALARLAPQPLISFSPTVGLASAPAQQIALLRASWIGNGINKQIFGAK
jgi:hypothetical protein